MENELYLSKAELLQAEVIKPKTKNKNSQHILLVHGFATDSRSWKLFVEKNRNHYIHLINLPGHGSINYSKKDMDFDNIVNSIVQYILDLDIKKIVVIGHSFGAGISLVVNERLKKINSNKLSKLILLAPYTKYSIPKVYNKIPLFNVQTENDFLHLQEAIFKDPKLTLERLEEFLYEKETINFFKSNWKYLKYIIFQMSKPTTFAKINNAIDSIDANTYLLLGEYDMLVPSTIIIERFQSVYPLLYISVYKNCGHGFFVEKDVTFSKEIKKILEL